MHRRSRVALACLALASLVGSAFSATVEETPRQCLISLAQVQLDICAGEVVESLLPELPPTVPLPGRAYRVVKLGYPVTDRDRAALLASGAEVLGYLPYDAFVVRVPPDWGADGLESVLWSGDFDARLKVSPILGQAVVGPPEAATLPVLVALHPDEGADRVLAAASRNGLASARLVVEGPRELRPVFDVAPAELGAFLRAVAPLAEVASVELQLPMGLLNSEADWVHQSWSTGSTPVFDRGLYGCGQVVAYMDSGLDFDHCAFSDAAAGPPPVEECAQGASCPAGVPDFAQRKVALYYKWSAAGDALGDAACSSMGGGHGTHVGGSIAGDAPDPYVDCTDLTSSGNSGSMDGTAPGAWLIHQEMGESLDYVNSLGGTVYHALSTAHTSGARVHSNSWGGGCCFLGLFCILCSEVPYDTYARDADRAVYDHPDLAVLFAAGNDGDCCDPPASIGSPGVAKNVITVGAAQRGAAAENVASFSSRGWTGDRRTKPDVIAQGEGIVSTASDGSVTSGNCSTCTMSGTSMATPTAAGLTALVREYLARGFYPTGAATPANQLADPSAAVVKALLVNGARDMTGPSQGAAPNQQEGWGRIHLDDVLFFTGDSRVLWLVDRGDGVSTGDAHEYPLQVVGAQPLKVTLTWSDHPATVNASPTLVNDLRLELVTPGGDTFTQKLPAGNPPNPFADASTSGFDDRNTVEQVLLAAPVAGTYTARVRGVNVPFGPQPYALVATGALSHQTEPPLFADGFESGDTTAWSTSQP